MYGSITSGKKLFTVFGTPVHAHGSAALLAVIILLMYGSGGPQRVVGALVIIAVAFIGVVGHELGHAFAVRKLGYGRSQIFLGGFGGQCQWNGRPTRKHAIAVALAGPAASLAMALVGALLFVLIRPVFDGLYVLRVFVTSFVALNLLWGVFNLIPIHPMDGGQALRQFLGMRMPSRLALRRSLIVSFVVGGLLMVAAALYNQLFMVVLVGFLLFQNWNEWQRNQL